MKTKCVACDVLFVAKNKITKYCTPECRKAFGHRRRRNNGYILPEWNKKANAERYREQNRELIRARQRAHYAKFHSYVAEYKLARGCADCGYKAHHAGLEFDHVDGVKAFNISRTFSYKRFHREVEKCEVVCAICHNIRTYARHHLAKGVVELEELKRATHDLLAEEPVHPSQPDRGTGEQHPHLGAVVVGVPAYPARYCSECLCGKLSPVS